MNELVEVGCWSRVRNSFDLDRVGVPATFPSVIVAVLLATVLPGSSTRRLPTRSPLNDAGPEGDLEGRRSRPGARRYRDCGRQPTGRRLPRANRLPLDWARRG